MQRMDGDRIRVSGLWSIDPKFKSIPAWLISFFVEKFMGYAIHAYVLRPGLVCRLRVANATCNGLCRLEKQASVLKPEYQEHIRNNPHLYEYLRQRLAEAPIPSNDEGTMHV